jgi:TolA-binding protein
MTYWTAMAQLKLGQCAEAKETFTGIYDYSLNLEATEPKIDYFATSLPTMLLFEENLPRRNRIAARFLRAQARSGLNQRDEAISLLGEILKTDSNHAGASDLLDQIQPAYAGTR